MIPEMDVIFLDFYEEKDLKRGYVLEIPQAKMESEFPDILKTVRNF